MYGLKSSHADQAKEHDEAIKRLQGQYDRIQMRLHAMYLDKLDGKIEGPLFDSLSVDWRKQQDRCLREIERLQSADQSYLEEGITTWADGELKVTLREPFGFIAKMAKFISGSDSENGASFADRFGWLGNLDYNRTLKKPRRILQSLGF